VVAFLAQILLRSGLHGCIFTPPGGFETDAAPLSGPGDERTAQKAGGFGWLSTGSSTPFPA